MNQPLLNSSTLTCLALGATTSQRTVCLSGMARVLGMVQGKYCMSKPSYVQARRYEDFPSWGCVAATKKRAPFTRMRPVLNVR